MHRWAAFVLLGAATLLGACAEDEEFVCEGTTEPARACCAFARVVLDNCKRCNPDSDRDCIDSLNVAIDDTSSGQGCEGADVLVNPDSFYGECLPAMKALACTDTALPESCREQISYEL
jgi:hypothetical protein